MNDAWWVLKTFGIKAGFRFIIDTVISNLSRHWDGNKVSALQVISDDDFRDIFSSVDVANIQESIERAIELRDDDIEAVQVHYFDHILN